MIDATVCAIELVSLGVLHARRLCVPGVGDFKDLSLCAWFKLFKEPDAGWVDVLMMKLSLLRSCRKRFGEDVLCKYMKVFCPCVIRVCV